MNRFLRLLLLSLLLFSGSLSFSQSVHGFYITGLGSFLGNQAKEDSILQYSQSNGFNYFAFYDLGNINWTSASSKNTLGAFISKARNQYGILQFGAVVETYDYASTKILPYNNSRTNASEKFDVINLEFEFWATATINSSYCNKFLSPGGYSCDTAGAWRFSRLQFSLIDSMCAANGLISEVYLGWPTAGQMAQLASIADRILLHAYRTSDVDVFAYSKNRLKDIAATNTTTKVIPIFSSEPAFMGPWLNSHPLTQPYQTYTNDFTADPGTFKQFINLDGYHWFTYNMLPKNNLAAAAITTSGPTSFCPGGTVTLTANPGISYLWLPGGQITQSITVGTPGTYSVTVLNSVGNSATSSPVTVSFANAGTTPTISASGSVSFCPGGSVTLSSSNASNYLWSTGQTTQTITVYTPGNYTVTTGSGTCTATSSAVNVNVSSTPAAPIISSSGSLNVCPGATVTLTSSPANGYLWSTGQTTASIVVSAAGSYTVNAYSGPNCSATSLPAQVNALVAPAPPTISFVGTTVLSTAQPTVDLISSPSNTYLWTTNQTTQNITVNAAGSYAVKITDANGCTASSAPVTITTANCTPPAVPTISFTGLPAIAPGQTITLTSSPAGGYLWSTGETTSSITISSPGTYYVRVYNAGNCYSNSLPITITLSQIISAIDPVAANNTSEDFQFSVYPNPARETVKVSFVSSKTENYFIQIYDVTGREVLNQKGKSNFGVNDIPVNTASLHKGVYLVSLNTTDHKQLLKLILE